MKDKTAPEKLQGQWILELGELAGLKKVDVETVKAFITRQDDKFRHSYGYSVEDHPRQCIIVGSTNNEDGFLRDITGNRRFWPVTCATGGAHRPWQVADVVEQLWAEAYMLYQHGEPLYLTPEVERLAETEQSGALESDAREGVVEEYLERLLPEDWDRMDLAERRGFLRNDQFNGGDKPGTVRRTVVQRGGDLGGVLWQGSQPDQAQRHLRHFRHVDAHRRLGEVQGEQERPDTPSALWAAALLSASCARPLDG